MGFNKNDEINVISKTADCVQKQSWRNWLIGRPLPTADAPHQTIGKFIGLAVFASDALSSTAYATQEMLVILAVAGTSAFQYSIPISFAIVALLAILIISYQQIIYSYPDGGGAYVVARDNLGKYPALIAAAALLTDYVLTVSVSISSSVAQIISAYPDLFDIRITIAILMVVFITVVNLRGVRESGTAFSIPTYFFLVMMFSMVGIGFYRYFNGTLSVVENPPEIEMIHVVQPITFFLILRAFSNGTSAVTGVEAISNGITAFKEPRSKNASVTLVWLSVILGSLMLMITFLSHQIRAVPAESETVISQLARTIYNTRGILYIGMIIATTVILVMAANTAFAGFPRLSALAAEDGFLPRQLTYRGSRLVYSNGIIALAGFASLLIIIFKASVTNLIPLYAIGVFLSFTLAQIGMARRWWKTGHLKPGEKLVEAGSTLTYDKSWRQKFIINSFGGLTTAVVMFVFALTKFADGAWIVILLTPLLVYIFYEINQHYKRVAEKLSLDNFGAPTRLVRNRVIIPISGVHRGTLAALRYAKQISNDITAIHVSIDPGETEKLQKKWEKWGDGIRLVILESPYRLFIEPLLTYIDEIADIRQSNEMITIVVPQFMTGKFISSLLHARTADTLRKVLLDRKDIVITEIPYHTR